MHNDIEDKNISVYTSYLFIYVHVCLNTVCETYTALSIGPICIYLYM